MSDVKLHKAQAAEEVVARVKGLLIDRFILIGTILFLIIFIVSPWDIQQFKVDLLIELVALIFLFIIYWQRKRIPLNVKTSLILFIVFIVYISDLIQFSIYSTDKVLLVLIPFLCILVFDLRTTIVLFLLALMAYIAVAFLSLEGFLGESNYLSSAVTVSDWFQQLSTVLIVALVLSTFVYYYNESITNFILDLEETNINLSERDKMLEASLGEKNVMIQEIHHRVKNNLAVVSGLLELQSLSLDNSDFKYILSKSTNRIMSIAKVHEMLYQSEDFNNIPFEEYIHSLTEIIARSINKDDKIIHFNYDIQIESLSINHGVPLGIIFNELITNSIKYGFVNTEENTISISVSKDENLIHVVYSDNGIGISDFEAAKEQSLGFKLVHSLMEQIDADFSFDTKNKFRLDFSFPAESGIGPYQKHTIVSN